MTQNVQSRIGKAPQGAPYRMSRIARKFAVMSGKGGVGKTTVSVNLATGLAKRGKRVGILDVDIHGPNVPKMLGTEGESLTMSDDGIEPVEIGENLRLMSMSYLLQDRDSAVIWRGPMKTGVIEQFLGDVNWGDLDYLVIDLPPGTGDESLSIAQKIPEAEAIVVTTPQEVALLDSRKSVSFARQLGMKVLGIVENMSGFVCPHCGNEVDLFKRGGGERTATEMGVPYLGRLPLDPGIVAEGDVGVPLMWSDRDSPAKAFFEELMDIIERGNGHSPDSTPRKKEE